MVSSFMVAISGVPSVFKPDNPMNFDRTQTIELSGIVFPSVSIYPYHIHRNAVDGFITIDDYKIALCLMLANHAYESVKSNNDGSPEFEFFRHIRNAASHANNFYFTYKEPSRAASWRSISINDGLKGRLNPLHGHQCFSKTLGISDLLLLLSDIEKKL